MVDKTNLRKYTLNSQVEPIKDTKPEAKKNTALVGRQSIYDVNLDVFAYELLYRPAEGQNFAPSQFDGNKATSEVMLNTFLEIGLEKIAGKKRAFINNLRTLIIKNMANTYSQAYFHFIDLFLQ